MKHRSESPTHRPKVPHFNSEARALWFGRALVKTFRQPASAQEQILLAFQELRWRRTIDDPLPHIAGIDPKRRLHDAIRNLNRNQRVPRLHFFGDGSGKRIGWERRS